MMTKQINNRRNDKRLHLPDVKIKVRKLSLGVSSVFVDCLPIDVSQNGVAFSSGQLDFELLQKIYIELSVGNRKIEGKALICHVAENPDGVRYGVLFIDVSPSIEEALSLENLSSTWVREFAASMADNLVLSLSEKKADKQLKKAQINLFDGVDAFRCRLNELVDDESVGAYQLDSLFEFNRQAMTVTLPMRGSDGGSLSRCTIKPVLTKNRKIVFETDSARTFSNLFDVLQEISDTFQWILSEPS